MSGSQISKEEIAMLNLLGELSSNGPKEVAAEFILGPVNQLLQERGILPLEKRLTAYPRRFFEIRGPGIEYFLKIGDSLIKAELSARLWREISELKGKATVKIIEPKTESRPDTFIAAIKQARMAAVKSKSIIMHSQPSTATGHLEDVVLELEFHATPGYTIPWGRKFSMDKKWLASVVEHFLDILTYFGFTGGKKPLFTEAQELLSQYFGERLEDEKLAPYKLYGHPSPIEQSTSELVSFEYWDIGRTAIWEVPFSATKRGIKVRDGMFLDFVSPLVGRAGALDKQFPSASRIRKIELPEEIGLELKISDSIVQGDPVYAEAISNLITQKLRREGYATPDRFYLYVQSDPEKIRELCERVNSEFQQLKERNPKYFS